MKVRHALSEGAQKLAATSETPRLDAELLMSFALGVDRQALLLSHLDREGPQDFEPLLARRAAGEPVAYIIGRREFWTIDLEVGPGVLVPRPDSETLMEAAVDHWGDKAPGRILDLGTGPGTLLLAALDQWQQSTGLGIDRSDAALARARRNAVRLGLGARAEFRSGDWGEGLNERFDLVLCNPPYVQEGARLPRDVADWEPHEALFAGADGLADYRRLASQIPRLLGERGIACVEVGAGQHPAVGALFQAEGLSISPRRDLAGIVRCLLLSH